MYAHGPRFCLPHTSLSRASRNSIYERRAGITKNTGGNPADSPRRINKPDGAKSGIYVPGNGTRARKVDSIRRSVGNDFIIGIALRGKSVVICRS